MLLVTNTIIQTSTFFAQAYGTGTYSCGAYEQGCTTGQAGTTPGVPNTGMLLSEPSFVIPGSLLLAVVIAVLTTFVAKKLRQRTK